MARIFVGSNTLLQEDIKIDDVINYQPRQDIVSLDGLQTGSDNQIQLSKQGSRDSNLRSERDIAMKPSLHNLIPSSIIKKAGKSRVKHPANAKTVD
jgi:hypothetical protein